MSSFENIIVESNGPVTRITLNRPKALNALNRALLGELGSAVRSLPSGTRVVVLTGAGEKAFAAGADISEMTALDPIAASDIARVGHDLGVLFESLEQITIAEVNGFALGGGCEIMLSCDLAIAADTAKLGQPEVKLGVTPGFGGTTRLVKRIGLPRAIQLVVTGEQIDAAEALRIGLVNEVVPKDKLRERVDAIAKMISENAPRAVALAKRSMRFAWNASLSAANAYEQEIFGMCFATADQKEGMKAFLEKRKATWTGK
jgi:enoyl-CoA hydratase